jgi:hypothetical protein
MFLPDRYIKGECPKCGAKDQYGDNCDVCGAVYSPTELKNPYSAADRRHAGAEAAAQHYFFQLSSPRCIEFLQQWTTTPGRLQPEVLNKIREWFATDDEGRHVSLADWDISRDAPYFGIRIPDTEDKYFYVWLDAPVGYLASLKNWFGKTGRDYDAFMADPAVEQIHFIGKDITYFHTLFWPAMLHFSGRKHAGQGQRARLHHAQRRREDEQEPRHRHVAAALPGGGPERGMAALLHRGQAQRARRGHRLQPRGLHRPRQQRPGGQVRQYRQPRRGLPGQAIRRPAVGRHRRRGPGAARRPARVMPRPCTSCTRSASSARRCAR